MIKIIIQCLAIFIFYNHLVVADDNIEVVNLTYIYETRCPYCADFLENQLYPAYQRGIGKYVNLTAVVYTSPDESDNTLSCQHGDNECYISRAQVCSLKDPSISQETRVDYLSCTEQKVVNSEEVTDDDIKACLTQILPDVSWESVNECINGQESFDLLLDNYKTATSYNVVYVPYLIFFGNHDESLEDAARADFFGTICNLLTTKPDICQNGI